MSFLNCFYLLTLLLHVILAVAQDVQFEADVLMETYLNPSHLDSAGNCCVRGTRGNSCGGRQCNNLFIFCAGPLGSTLLSRGSCPYGMYNFTVNNDEITFPENASIVAGSQVLNPLVFRGRERIPEDLEFIIEIDNVINDRTERIASFNLAGPLRPSEDFGMNRPFDSVNQRVEITMRFRLRCSTNYFGTDCNTYCVPTERFTCNSTNGAIVCREGYQNETLNCSICVSVSGCGTTDESIDADTSQLSQGAVAGVVIVTLILLTLATAGVVIGIVFWVYQPWSNGWFGLEEWITKRRAKEGAIENPVYEETDIETSRNESYTAHAPPVRGVRYTQAHDKPAANGHVHLEGSAQLVDDDNPLYASSALEKILNPWEGNNGTRNKEMALRRPPPVNVRRENGHAQTNGGVTAANHHQQKIATLRESGSLEQILLTAEIADVDDIGSPKQHQSPSIVLPSDIQKEQQTQKRNSLPSDPQQGASSSLLVASQSVDNLLQPNGKLLNPYGEYSDQTLQRAISGNSFSEEQAAGNGETSGVKEGQVFDNPDYEFVEVNNETDKPIDGDYEEI